MTKRILLIGKSSHVTPFLGLFEIEGVFPTTAEDMGKAIDVAKTEQFDGIVFVLPTYYDDVTKFVQQVRQVPGYELTPILYLGSLIEGGDLTILHQHGVKTLTLGPVPNEEIVRFVVKEL